MAFTLAVLRPLVKQARNSPWMRRDAE